MKKIFILLSIVALTCSSCSKNSSNQKAKTAVTDSISHEFYQKESPYDGLKGGHIDSVVSKIYSANHKELISIVTKHYNTEGYVVSNENRSFSLGELSSAKHTSYTRDQISLVTYQLENYLTNSGTGYTKQYNLISREFNKEIWEYIEKMPDKALTLTAEIREYSQHSLKIYSQIGNSDSTALSVQYAYNSNGLISEVCYYNNNVVIGGIETKYNEFDAPSETIHKLIVGSNVATPDIEKYEYRYDNDKNPVETKIYKNNELLCIIENTIYYNN